MQVAVIGGGVYGRGGKSIQLALAMQEMAKSIERRPDVIVFDECNHLRAIDMVATQIEESEHPGERHREVVKRVNSGRSRAGKAARWS